ncbi:MAG TPA: ABC transporter substrate-binding protein [Chloroflexota bacterium]|nr:ABC transporter substrate-binding protein [Chloroflexota bacterium]
MARRARHDSPARCLFVALVLAIVACAPAGPGASSAPPAPAATAAATAPPAATASPPAASAAASAGGAGGASPASGTAGLAPLPTTPVVSLKAGVVPIAPFAPFFVGRARGYFAEVGLDVEIETAPSVIDLLPALAQGQLQVGACTSNLACLNFLNRRTDIQIVAGLQAAGRTEKSRDSVGLVVRQDIWDSGAIRGAQDLPGRTLYLIGGEGGTPHAHVARWLRRNGVDPRSIEIAPMTFPDVFAAMQNRGIEVGYQTEPLLSGGIARGVHHLLAGLEELDPAVQELFVMYWSGIDRLGPLVGERFAVALLRATREYLNAFEYGVDQDAVIEVLTQETPIKDPAVYRQIHYPWIDPDGAFSRASLESDAELFRDLGLIGPVDLSQAFQDKYRQAAVQRLGEYRPPR